MAEKTQFVGVRLSAEEAQQLLLVSLQTEAPGNVSAAVRWLVDQSRGQMQQRLGEGERYQVLSGIAQRMAQAKLSKGKGGARDD
jgi:hypothetical protein